MVETEYTLVLSQSSSNADQLSDEIQTILQKKGIEVRGPTFYPTAGIDIIRRVALHGRKPTEKKYNWVGYVAPLSVKYLEEHQIDRVHGRGFKFQRRIHFDAEDLIDKLPDPPKGTVVQTARQRTEPHAEDCEVANRC